MTTVKAGQEYEEKMQKSQFYVKCRIKWYKYLKLSFSRESLVIQDDVLVGNTRVFASIYSLCTKQFRIHLFSDSPNRITTKTGDTITNTSFVRRNWITKKGIAKKAKDQKAFMLQKKSFAS